jgi:hypothetical protein
MNELDVTRAGLEVLGAYATNAQLLAFAAARHGVRLDLSSSPCTGRP